ncbi:MAG: M56 family metallopeptidase [Ruminococcaceae bacterium]|nr:M56 family metallopeptidase [Oscillospiraceae bacterium]
MTAFFIGLLNLSLTATIVLAVVLLLRALLVRHIPRWGIGLLWLVAAIALVCPIRPTSHLSIWKTTDPLLMTTSATTEVLTHETVWESLNTEETWAEGEPYQPKPAESGDITDGPSYYEADLSAPTVEPGEVPSRLPTEFPAPSLPQTGTRVEWVTLAFVIWCVGVTGMSLYALIRYLQLKHRVAVSVPFVDGAYLCDTIPTPFLLGFFPPKIYLPSSMAEGDFVPVIAHERAHIARGDHIMKALGWWILTVHWFHPLVWISYHLFCRDLEFACDARAVHNLGEDERRSYAEALLSCSIGSRRLHALSHPLAFGEVGVKERISAVIAYRRPGVLRCAAGIVLLPVLAALFLTAPIRGFVDVLEQNGYTVHKAELYQRLEITVPADMVSGYAKSGATVLYDPGDVVVYDHAPTMLSLTKITPSGADDDRYWMIFTFTYRYIPTEGVLTTLIRPEYKDEDVTTWSAIPELLGDVRDARTTYPDRADCCYEAEGVTFGIVVDREVLENAEEYIAFTVGGLADVYFSRGEKNPSDAILVTEGGPVGPDCVEMYVNNYDNQPIDLTLALEAFPDASLASDAMNIYMVEDDKQHWILSGMPVRNVYLSDLTGDGKPEFCASVYWGSGMIDSHIVVYDYVEKQEYTLWDRGVFDYRLEMENNTLYAVMTDYNTRKELYRDVLMLIPTEDGYALSMGEPNSEGVLSDLFKHAEVYVSERCIYMTPLSSSLSIGGDTGYRYLIDPEQHSFCQIDRDTGSIQMVGSLLGGWKAFPWTDEEWAELFVFGAIKDTAISEVYSHRKAMPLGADQYLLSMDDELWLMKASKHPDGSEYVWSIHELVPESQKGFAYYRYMPAVSALPPYLTITFDLPEDMNISAYCGETALASVPDKGWAQEWNHSWQNKNGELQVCWSPNERLDGYIPGGVSQASITFTALNDDQTRYCAGTIYITRDDNITDSWDDWYRVTVVGDGLTMSNDESGFGALVSWDGNGFQRS